MTTDAKLLDQREILATIKMLDNQPGLLDNWFFEGNDALTDSFLVERTNLATGIMDARAEDAEAKMTTKDTHIEQMVATVIDWSNTVHINASEVRHWREVGAIPVGYRGSLQKYAEKERQMVDQEIGRLRAMLDNRREWLKVNALLGTINVNNNGVITGDIDMGVPAGQKNQAPGTLWDQTNADPILNIQTWQATVGDTYGVKPTRLVISERIARILARNAKWARAYSTQDMKYFGFRIQDALDMIKTECGLDEIVIYDAVYTTRAADKTITRTRFLADDRILLLPPKQIGTDKFAELITTPHPENGWEPGYYAWEEETRNPWGLEIGAGMKMWPVIYHPELIFWADVL